MSLVVNQRAPSFSLPDQNGSVHTLEQYEGSWLLLYFYPKDDTPGCTVEACSFRDGWQECKKAGLIVLGVSPDSVESHRKFAAKHGLPFTLLSDTDKRTLIAYQAWGEKSMFGKKYMGVLRSSVLIDPNGKIAKLYPKVNVKNHARDVLKDLKKLKNVT